MTSYYQPLPTYYFMNTEQVLKFRNSVFILKKIMSARSILTNFQIFLYLVKENYSVSVTLHMVPGFKRAKSYCIYILWWQFLTCHKIVWSKYTRKYCLYIVSLEVPHRIDTIALEIKKIWVKLLSALHW